MEATDYAKLSADNQLDLSIKLFDRVEFKSGYYVMDIGCGTGNLASLVCDKLGSTGRLLGIDPDESRIKLARESYKEKTNMEFVVCKGGDLPLEEQSQYDVIYSTFVFHWITEDEEQEIYHQAFKALKPGGILFVMACPTAYSCPIVASIFDQTPEIKKAFYATQHFTKKEKREEMARAAGFRVTLSEECIRYTKRTMDIDTFLKWLEASLHGRYPIATKTDRSLLDFTGQEKDGLIRLWGEVYEMYLVKDE